MVDHIVYNRYFFLGFFFFFTPPVPVAPVVIGVLPPATSGVAGATRSPCASDTLPYGWGRRFCIFCISERFKASKRFRNIDEWVLNFRH